MVKKNSIPERWRSLTSVGQRVPGSRFIAFKVPLKGATNKRVTQNQKFTPKDLITSIRSQNEELGMIIDLTNTERYYTTKDLPKSVQYVKLHTAGLKIPDDATIHQFKRVVRQFMFDNADNDKLIGVHCTTGINRTGYLICRYMIDVEGWRPLYSINAFAHARGHPIEGAVYAEDLIKGAARSNVGIDLPLTEEEKRALAGGTDELPKDRGQIRSLLDQANEFGDFDARDRRPLPLMRAKSGDPSEDYFDPRDGRAPNMLGDHDLRLPLEPPERAYLDDMPEHMLQRFPRPGDYYPEDMYDPDIDFRRKPFPGNHPRPLMELEEDYGQMEMQRGYEDNMDFDMRARGRPNPAHGLQSREFPPEMDMPGPRPVPLFARGKMNDPGFDETAGRMSGNAAFQEDEDDPRFDPHGQEGMAYPFRGPGAQRMNPRPSEQSMSNRMHPRESRFMDEGPEERMYPRNVRGPEGPVGKGFPPRNPRMMNAPMGPMAGPRDERMHPRDPQFMDNQMNDPKNTKGIKSLMSLRPMESLPNQRKNAPFREGQGNERMEGPLNERMPPRDVRSMEGPMAARDPRLMEGSMNERMHPRAGRPMEGHDMDSENYEIMHPSGMDGTMNDQMYSRDPRGMDVPKNDRMYPRDVRSMGGPMNDRMYPRDTQAYDASMNDHMYPSDANAMEGPTNDHMYPRDTGAMDGPMGDQMRPRNARAGEGSMNEWMPQRDGRAMGAPVNQRMAQGDFQGNKPRPLDAAAGEYYNDPRSFEGRKMNPSEEAPRGANRFAPYAQRKPPQPPAAMAGPQGPAAHGWYA
ncbi:uncharacterized protein [Hyperolius riggenbachi]|uniref:uncharacterized protein n=1 Tax=Hyperolius riggenbachi TaxID=752182 RepID=UPI0035A332DE